MSNNVREKLEAYFASLNSTSGRMMADIISSRKEYNDRWENMTPEEQSDILWRSIVKPDAVIKYNKIPAKSLDVEYFPVLRTRPGEKIIVDEDSASAKSFVSCSTWQDEHSAPFRWETQSQLEFRFFDDSDAEKEKPKTLERETSKSTPKLTSSENSPKSIRSERSVRSQSSHKAIGSESSPKAIRSENSPKPVRSENSPKPVRSENSLKPVRSENSPKPVRSENSPKSIRSETTPKMSKSEKLDPKKEDEVKRHTLKRPEVPPPPVPPHATSPVPTHSENPPVPPHIEKSMKDETPIYAKVVKRKSAAKTLLISEMKAHRKAKEEMKPAVPPRMSLELKGDVDLSKFKVQDIDIDSDGIPKTGFDFLDNW